MQSVDGVVSIGKFSEIERFGIIDDQEDLGLNPKVRIGTGFGQTGAQPFARRYVAGCIDPVDFNCVAWFESMKSPLTVCRVFKFCCR